MPPPSFLSFLDQHLNLDTAEQAEEVAHKIEQFDHMDTLELKGNTIGVEAGSRLAAAIATHPELERCLWSDMFTSRLKHEIPPVLKSMTAALMQAGCHIRELDLSDNAFGPIGAEGIQEFLVSPSAYSLETLKLNNNGLGAGGITIAKCLLQCYENAKQDGRQFQLKTFIAGRNRLENPGAIALAEAFEKIGTLEYVSVPQNGIRSEGICALAMAFQSNKELKVVVLNDNTCTAKGAIHVAIALTELTKLEVLDMGDCLCRDAGVAAIIAQMCDGEHHNLKTLNLSGAEITGFRAQRIIESWRQSYSATGARLIITHNCFGSMFNGLKEQAKGLEIDIGDEEDDEGSLSERESEKSSTSEEEAETEYDEEEAGDELTPLRTDPRNFTSLLTGVSSMKITAESQRKLSFLDEQRKMDTDEDAEPVAKKIEQTPSIKELELRGNTLGIEAGKRIAKALENHPELERCLWSDLFTGRLKDQIPPVLRSLCNGLIVAGCHIRELDLSDNAFGPIGAEGIQEFLVSPSAYSLETLKLNNNGLGAGGITIAKCLLKCHENAKRDGREFKLKTFIAGRNRLENPGAVALADAFKALGSLEEIALHQDGIRPEGIEVLARSLEFNPNLRILNLQDNTASVTGSYALATAVKSLKKLESINFGDCLCRDAGCHAIIDSLSPDVHSNLMDLDLSGAELTGEAAILICDKWKKFPRAKLTITANNYGHLFKDVLAATEGANAVIGDQDDDQGTLSDDEEERRSATSYDESDEEEHDDESQEETENEAVVEQSNKENMMALEVIEKRIAAVEEEFDSSVQESAARLLLQLATVVDASGGDLTVLQKAIDVAEDIVERVRNVRRRPIPTVTQMLNNIVAQMGVTIKSEVFWGIRPSIDALLSLLDGLPSLTDPERHIVDFYLRH